MQHAFTQLGEVPGVLGAFVVDVEATGHISGSSLPAFFGPEMLEEAAAPLLRALETARSLPLEVQFMQIRYGDTRLVVSPWHAQQRLVVVCQEETDQALLLQALERLSSQVIPSQPEPFAADRGAVATPRPHKPFPVVPPFHIPQEQLPASDLKPEQDGQSALKLERSLESESRPAPIRGNARSIQELPFTLEVRARIQETLARYIGPIAPLLVTEALRECTTSSEVLQHLAREIEADEDRRAFLSAIGPYVS